MIVQDLFSEKKMVKVCAPMVRYSKLQFRSLVRSYGVDLCFTPMIMADSFIRSDKARQNELTTDSGDSPLVVQFAANTVDDFTEAAQLVAPYSDGVDLNCGCPQRWAMKIGIGAQLLTEPEKMRDMVLSVRNRVSDSYTVSVKLRLLNNTSSSVELCRQMEKAGVHFLTVHGRTKEQRSQPVNVEALKQISDSVQIPVIANGDVRSLDDAARLQDATGCQGVMAARGILQNPAMFQGLAETPVDCVKTWVQLSLACNLHYMIFHHHLVFMLEKVLGKHERRKFNSFTTYCQVLHFLNHHFGFTFDADFGAVQSLHSTLTTHTTVYNTDNIPSKYFVDKISASDNDSECILYDSVSLYS